MEDHQAHQKTADAGPGTVPTVHAAKCSEREAFSEMQVVIPSWLMHKGKVSIATIDISADGTRVATGGADGSCRIWGFKDIIAEAAVPTTTTAAAAPLPSSSTEGLPLQCRQPLGVAMFAGPVSCVRWNPKISDVLAVATDDSKVTILKRISTTPANGSPSITIFGVEGKFFESYVTVHTYTLATSEVPDIAWSPDGKRIASCCLEGLVTIHNVETNQLIKSVQFDGPVKGLSWDPLDRYIAAQSEDTRRSLAIITCPDYELQQKIASDGMFDKNLTLFYRRLSWAPDGTLLGVCATLSHGSNGSGGRDQLMHSASFLRRTNFSLAYDISGPSKEINVLRFSRAFYPPGSRPAGAGAGAASASMIEENEREVYFPCAMSSQDCLITICLRYRRPDEKGKESSGKNGVVDKDEEERNGTDAFTTEYLVLREVSKSSVNDMVWTPDGFGLLVATDNGKVIYMKFDSALLGTPCTEDQFTLYLTRVHGDKLNYRPPASSYDIPETPLQLQLEQRAAAVADAAAAQHTASIYSVYKPTAEEEEIEVREHSEQTVTTKNGRRRITPRHLTTAQFLSLSSAPPKQQSQQQPLSASMSPTSTLSSSVAPAPSSLSRAQAAATTETSTVIPSSTVLLNSNPNSVSSTSSITEASRKNDLLQHRMMGKHTDGTPQPPQLSSISPSVSDEPSNSSNGSSLKRSNSAMKRLNECALSPSSSSSSSSSRTVAGECTSSTSSTATIAPPKPKRRKEAPDAGEVLLGAPAVTTAPPLAMHDPVDVVRRTITFSASAGSSSSGGRGFVEARGIDSGNGGCEMTRVQLRYEEISWAAVVRGRATHIAYNASLCAVSCSDSSLVVLDFRSGRALLPKINLGGGGVAVLLEASKTRHLAVVTSTRELSVFDVFERRALVSRALVDPAVLRSSDTDLSLTVTSAGVAVLSCAAVQMAYDPALGAWVYVARKLRASALERPRDPAADHALALWEAEQELALADLLEDKNAHKAALLAYTRLLVDGSDEARLRVLFDDILHSKATEHVVAFTARSRKDILQELLVITAKNRKLQRLCEEFSASLEESAGTDDDDPWGIPL